MPTEKIVLDTNVLFSAAISPGKKCDQVLNVALAGAVAIYYCDEIYFEYARVLNEKAPDKSRVESLLAAVRQNGRPISKVPRAAETATHYGDQIFLDLTQHLSAVLITGNIKHFPPLPNILTPARFLEIQGERTE